MKSPGGCTTKAYKKLMLSTQEEDAGGWQVSPTYLRQLQGHALNIANENISLKQIEAVVLAVAAGLQMDTEPPKPPKDKK